MEPLVSVCLVTYNQKKYIQDTLKSILNQTYSNIEIIVSDDASDDETVDLVNRMLPLFKEKDIPIKIFKNPHNIGITCNCNSAIKHSRGDYVKLFAGDDIMFPECIKTLVGEIKNNPDAMVVYSNGYYIDEDAAYGNILQKFGTKKLYKNHRAYTREKMFEELMKLCFIIAPTAIINKKAFERYGLFDENISYDDYDFWLRLARHKELFVYTKECLVGYRRAGTSVTNYATPDGRKKLIYFLKEEHKVIIKNIAGLPLDKKREYFKMFLERYRQQAIDIKQYDIALNIWLFMKKNHYT